MDITSRLAADLFGIQLNSAAFFYRKLHEMIAYYLEQEPHEIFDGAVELDESYFDGAHKGKRGDKVYTKAILNTKSETLMPLIATKVEPNRVSVYSLLSNL